MARMIMTFVLALILVVSSVFVVSADNSATTDNLKLNELVEKYYIKDVSSVPEGIQPIEFQSIDEMEKFLTVVSRPTAYDNFGSVKSELAVEESDGISIMATDPYTKYVTVKKGDTWVFGSFYVAADVEVYVTPNKKIITDCSDAYMMLEGFDLGVDYTEAYEPTAKVSSDKTKVTLKAKGTIDYYLLVDGLLKIYSKPYYYNKTFAVGDI